MKWNDARKVKPYSPRDPNALGTPVIVYMPMDDSFPTERKVFEAYYGRRATGSNATFYLHGSVLSGVTHWMQFPKEPK